MKVLAPAKINLYLRVGAVRDDGFHPLRSWMVTVGLFDTLTIEARSGAGIEFSCTDAALPTDDRNLVAQAARLLAREQKPTDSAAGTSGARIRLEKSIPAAAGLGGGSSDAARTLLGLTALWGLGLSRQHPSDLAAGLGSDVPFFLYGPSSICTGRGEKVRAVAPPAPRFALLILPGVALSTACVYEAFDQRASGKLRAVPPGQDWPGFGA